MNDVNPTMNEPLGTSRGPSIQRTDGGVWGSYVEKVKRWERIEEAARLVADQWNALDEFSPKERIAAMKALAEVVGD